MTRAKGKRPAWYRKGDHVVVAYGERCAGPGWANSPIWAIVRGADGALRVECVQPEEQTAEMHALFGVSAQAAADMTLRVQRYAEG